MRYLESARANIINLRIDDEPARRELNLTVAVRDLRKLLSELEGLSNLPEVVRVEIDAEDSADSNYRSRRIKGPAAQ